MPSRLETCCLGITAKLDWGYIYAYRYEILVYSDWLRSTTVKSRDATQVAYISYRQSLLDFHGVEPGTPESAREFWALDKELMPDSPTLYKNPYQQNDPMMLIQDTEGIAKSLMQQGVSEDDAIRIGSNEEFATFAEFEAFVQRYKTEECCEEQLANARKGVAEYGRQFALRVTNNAVTVQEAEWEWFDPEVQTEQGRIILANSALKS